jgi:hypothetical protein
MREFVLSAAVTFATLGCSGSPNMGESGKGTEGPGGDGGTAMDGGASSANSESEGGGPAAEGGTDGGAGADDGAGGPSPYSGFWKGTTSQGTPMGFTVNDAGQVDSLIVTIDMRLGQATCVALFHPAAPVNIANAGFSVIAKYPGGNPTTGVAGTFSGTTQASGTFTGFSGGFAVVCGSTVSVGTGSLFAGGTWQATPGVLACRYTSDGACDEPSGTYVCLRGTDTADCSHSIGGLADASPNGG